jgi:hypothetical protein
LLDLDVPFPRRSSVMCVGENATFQGLIWEEKVWSCLHMTARMLLLE